MIRALLSIRFRALFVGMTTAGKKKDKPAKRTAGTVILLSLLYLWVITVLAGGVGVMSYGLLQVYHPLGLDWLYFAMAGMLGLALATFGSVFSTQNQLYAAKDNELLLSLPIPPRIILLTRMIPLYAMNVLFAAVVMVPALVVYVILVGFSLPAVLLQVLSVLAVGLLAQTLASALGWLLHQLLRRVNKSVASLVFMVLFLGIYFTVYSNINSILQSIALSGQQIGNTLESYAWPIYAMGLGCIGKPLYALLFFFICSGLFCIVYWLLSLSFLRNAIASGTSRKKKRLDMSGSKVSSVGCAIVKKELKKFLGTPVYLTNSGVGLIMLLALAAAGLIFRSKVLEVLALIPPLTPYTGLLICAVVAFLFSASQISTPSVSLEGKNIWILKSLPLTAKQILLGKLGFHMVMTMPVSCVVALVLGIAFCDSVLTVLLTVLVCALLAAFTGYIGAWAGLRWAKLEYTNDAYPCKQSVGVLISMLLCMGTPALLGIGCYLTAGFLSAEIYMVLVAALLALLCLGLHKILTGWGVRKWDSLQA